MAEIPAGTEAPPAAASETSPAVESTGWVGNTGELGNGAPEAVQALLDNKKWTTVEQIVHGYTELEKFKGAGDGVIIPKTGDENYAEKIGEIFNLLGKPKTAEEYKYSTDSETQFDPELLKGFKEFALGENYTQSQLEGAINFQLDAVAAQEEIIVQELEKNKVEDITELKQIYGTNYEDAMRDANLVSDKHKYTDQLNAEGITDFPIVKQMLNHIANLEAEDGIAPGGVRPVTKSLQEQLSEIQANPAFMKKLHPEHKALHAKFMEINHEIANSGQAPKRMQA